MAEKVLKRYSLNKNPIAQSFYVDTARGIYVSKIDLFFKTKPTVDSIVSLELRPMESGAPDPQLSVPGSYVSLNQNAVNANTSYTQPGDTLTPTTFTFDSPVFLNPNQFYAFVINGSVKGYSLFGAEIEEFELGSTERRVDKNLVTGNLFQTDTGYTFSPALGQDLSFKIYKCVFDTTQNTKIALFNSPVPKKLLAANPITTTSGSTTCFLAHPDSGLIDGDSIVISGATDVGGLTAATHINGTRTITKIDATGVQFTAGTTASSSASGGGSNVLASQNYLYGTSRTNVEFLPLSGTQSYTFVKPVTGESYSQKETGYQTGDWQQVQTDVDAGSGILNVVAYTDTEVSNSLSASDATYYNNKSLHVLYETTTRDADVAAPIDLQRCSFTAVAHKVNNPVAGPVTMPNDAGTHVPIVYADETNPNGGSTSAKHVMNPVNLELAAKGIKVLYAGNVPKDSYIDVYYRTSTADINIYDQSWTLAPETSNNPKDDNPQNYYEYEHAIGGLYTSTLDEFDTFQIKFVFRSANQARVPSMKDVRNIALVR